MGAIRIEASYPHPPERVWFALTDPRALTEWLMPTTDFESRLGHRFAFRVDNPKGWSTVVECEIVELAPPRRLPKVLARVHDDGFVPDPMMAAERCR